MSQGRHEWGPWLNVLGEEVHGGISYAYEPASLVGVALWERCVANKRTPETIR
ncbi:hypothetical protein HHI36_000382, partial [Cryptolaemus montrouzieri]